MAWLKCRKMNRRQWNLAAQSALLLAVLLGIAARAGGPVASAVQGLGVPEGPLNFVFGMAAGIAVPLLITSIWLNCRGPRAA